MPSSLLAYNSLLKYLIYFVYPVRFSELIGNIREFIIPKKTPKNISGKVPFRFGTLIDRILTSHCSAARGLLTTDHVILNHGQVTWMTPELAPLSPNYHTTPTGKRFNSQQI
ncbi:hypothetical protein TNCV_51191 [Trichonephila clavipes]|nr:hypothetical protein TNCV_51191 [Trichonephila clavipes]